MGGLVAYHSEPGELLAALGAEHISGCVVLHYAIKKALDQPSRAAFAVFIEQSVAL